MFRPDAGSRRIRLQAFCIFPILGMLFQPIEVGSPPRNHQGEAGERRLTALEPYRRRDSRFRINSAACISSESLRTK